MYIQSLCQQMDESILNSLVSTPNAVQQAKVNLYGHLNQLKKYIFSLVDLLYF